jgi:Pentapeptide repeats (9 copies)
VLLTVVATFSSLSENWEGRITDRYSKAIDQLGSSNLQVRVGAIYALQRIARESPPDQRPIMEVLASYVRDNFDLKSPLRCVARDRLDRKRWRGDLFAVIQVLGSRSIEYDPTEADPDYPRLDLSHADLGRVYFFDVNARWLFLEGAYLYRANFSKADASKAWLRKACLLEASFNHASLNNTGFEWADLTGADFSDATLHPANFRYATLTGAKFPGANLSGADLIETKGLTLEQLNDACGDAQTKLPEGFAIRPCPTSLLFSSTGRRPAPSAEAVMY